MQKFIKLTGTDNGTILVAPLSIVHMEEMRKDRVTEVTTTSGVFIVKEQPERILELTEEVLK